MGIVEWIGIVTGIVAILGAIVGITKYIVQMQSNIYQERLKGEINSLHERFTEVDAKNKELLKTVATVKNIGSVALVKKNEIDNELLGAMKVLQASASSIFVPEPANKVSNFIFLSIHGPAATKLEKVRVPITKGIAGYVFAQGKSYISADTYKDTKYFAEVDKLSKYRITNIICVPLSHQGKVIGVVQFLNKSDKGIFNNDDLRIAENFALSVSCKVADFVNNTDNFQLLGITPEQKGKESTILFSDITTSLFLFEEMSVSVAIDLINEYLERQCDIAISYGATIDKYLGDGIMIRFNVPRIVEDHPLKAVQSALAMQKDFEKLKQNWINYGFPVQGIYNRIGIAYSTVYEVIIGHPQHQQLTVMGDSVNVACNLCNIADRDRNIILIDKNIHDKLSNKIVANKFPEESMKKIIGSTSAAYELISIS